MLSLIPFATGAALTYHYDKPSLASQGATHGKTEFGKPARLINLSLPIGMLLGFMVAPVASWHSKGLMVVTLGFLALFMIVVVRRLTANLKADLGKGNSVARVLFDRFLFDQSLIKSDGTKGK